MAGIDDMQAADDKTLRLAAPLVTAETLDKHLRYLELFRALLAGLAARGEVDPAHVAECHRRAREESGVDLETFGPLSALVADFAAKRGTVHALRARLKKLAEQPGDAEHQELEKRVRTELARLDSVTALERRYGPSAVGLLMEREDRVLDRQAAVTRALAGRA